MLDIDPGTASPHPYNADRAMFVRNLAARAWKDMHQHSILPTPRNFELWFTYLSDSNPALSHQLSTLLGAGMAPTSEQLRSLYSDCMTREIDIDTVVDHSEQMVEAVQAMVERVVENQASLRAYGDTLSGVAVQLDQDRTLDGLVHAVNTLTAETARASERNRILEQQLSASSTRITKLRQDLVEAKQESTTDGLTGLCNRRAFDGRLRRAMVRAKADQEPMSLVLLDIDHFKRFNDTYGHRTGDLVLRLVARMIADNVKGRDTAARYGGEEFAVILTGAELQAGAIVAGQMRALLDGKNLTNRKAPQNYGSVTISAGVVQFRPGDSIASLVERADVALYEAKRLGRNQVCTEELYETAQT